MDEQTKDTIKDYTAIIQNPIKTNKPATPMQDLFDKVVNVKPISKEHKEKQQEIIKKYGDASLRLSVFINRVLFITGGEDSTLSNFSKLVEDYGLVIYENEQAISSTQLLESLKHRKEQCSLDADNLGFWATLKNERNYQVRIDDVARAYCLAEMDTFPWYNHWCDRSSGKVIRLPIPDEIKADVAIRETLDESELFKERQKAVAEIAASRINDLYKSPYTKKTVEDLLNDEITSILNPNLNNQACEDTNFKPNPYFVELYIWKRMLEMDRLKSAKERDKVRVSTIDARLKEIEWYLNDYPLVENAAITQIVGIDGTVSHVVTEPKKLELSKLEEQQAAILAAIKAKGFNPMAIPDGEKGTIKRICELDYSNLFADTSFDRAWKKGTGNLWKMEHHESYARRGKN
jgi:hypothetical protein